MAVIQLNNLSKQFFKDASAIQVLDDINLTIPNGQTLAVLGPSGCGKSTLLRTLAGLESEYEGQILFNGEDIREMKLGDRNIGMVFQNYALYPHFEGHGNLSFFFRMRGAPNEEAEERIRITSEIMGIGFKSLLRRKPGTLSGGQQQRLAIGRAIVRNPNLFLFDEPLSNLDAKLRHRTRVELKRLLRRFNITAVYVTHDQVEAVALGDRVAVMREGRLEQVGPYRDLLDKPVNTFVASFLGNPPMNLFPGGKVSRTEIQWHTSIQALTTPLHINDASGRPVILGIRPEALRVEHQENPASDSLTIRGEVTVVEPDFGGQRQFVHVLCHGKTVVAITDLKHQVRLGETISLILPIADIHFFDEQAGFAL